MTADTIDPYVPVCGNVHFPPNARGHYDQINTAAVESSCQGYRKGEGAGGTDQTRLVSNGDWSANSALAPDCMGAFLVWWMQHFPGPGTTARGDDGSPLPSWWTYLFY